MPKANKRYSRLPLPRSFKKLTEAKTFKVGEQVEIVGNILIFEKTHLKKPFIGRILHINGEYITIRPRYQRWLGEWYRCEIRKLRTSGK